MAELILNWDKHTFRTQSRRTQQSRDQEILRKRLISKEEKGAPYQQRCIQGHPETRSSHSHKCDMDAFQQNLSFDNKVGHFQSHQTTSTE